MHGLFITGTDTGVGKTRIGTTLAHCLVERGVRVRKPVESDCPLPVYALGGMQSGLLDTARGHGAHGIALLSGIW